MSWGQAQPQQRYTSVPGFEREGHTPLMTPSANPSGPGTPDEKAGQYGEYKF